MQGQPPPGAKLEPPHPRDAAVESAAGELLPFLNDLIRRHSLTAFEYLFLLSNCTVRQAQRLCKHERDALEAQQVKA